jgi:hypothetical protein
MVVKKSSGFQICWAASVSNKSGGPGWVLETDNEVFTAISFFKKRGRGIRKRVTGKKIMSTNIIEIKRGPDFRPNVRRETKKCVSILAKILKTD